MAPVTNVTDPADYIAARVAALKPPPLPDDTLRARFAESLGGIYEWERPPLEPQIVETRQMDGYRRETVLFTTRPGLTAFGYMLIPDGMAEGERRPAILALPGHGRGVDSIVGIAADGTQRKLGDWEEYAYDYGLQCVAHGYPTLALEQISFGHRRRSTLPASNPEVSSCHEDSTAALMFGETIAGWRVWDAMRALDYLETRSEVDAKRLVTLGISGAGLTSLFTGALDTRVAVCIVSGYLNTFADSVLSIRHCVDNYAPGLSALCEMEDIAGLVAPRGLFAENGERDPIFPVSAFRRAAKTIQAKYTALGLSDRCEFETFEGAHQWHGAGVWPFLSRLLDFQRIS